MLVILWRWTPQTLRNHPLQPANISIARKEKREEKAGGGSWLKDLDRYEGCWKAETVQHQSVKRWTYHHAKRQQACDQSPWCFLKSPFQISIKSPEIFGDHPHTETLLPWLFVGSTAGWNHHHLEEAKKKAAKDPNKPKKPAGGAYGALAPKGPRRFQEDFLDKTSILIFSYPNISAEIGFGFWDGWIFPTQRKGHAFRNHETFRGVFLAQNRAELMKKVPKAGDFKNECIEIFSDQTSCVVLKVYIGEVTDGSVWHPQSWLSCYVQPNFTGLMPRILIYFKGVYIQYQVESPLFLNL